MLPKIQVGTYDKGGDLVDLSIYVTHKGKTHKFAECKGAWWVGCLGVTTLVSLGLWACTSLAIALG